MVSLISNLPILFSIDKGIKFMFALKSSKALSTDKAPIDMGSLKLPGSVDFKGKPFFTFALEFLQHNF